MGVVLQLLFNYPPGCLRAVTGDLLLDDSQGVLFFCDPARRQVIGPRPRLEDLLIAGWRTEKEGDAVMATGDDEPLLSCRNANDPV